MRFWQKIYILTLILFLLCLNAGIFSLAYYTFYENVENAENSCREENGYITKSFERDFEDMLSISNTASPVALMESYGKYYGGRGISLALLEDDALLFSSFESEVEMPDSGRMTHIDIDGARHIVIGSQIFDKYRFVYAKNVSSLDDDYHSLMITFAGISAGVSIFFALCLYFVLKKLSVPLEKLRRTTELIAGGDLSILADESGGDEVAMLAKSFNGMVRQIKEHMDALEENAGRKQMLVDNMAHELRTPLTSIHGYAEFLEKAAVEEEQRIEASQCIMSEAERLQRISEKVLDMAYIGKSDTAKTKVDLAELLSETAKMLEQKARKSGVSLVLGTGAAAATGDKTLLSMLFYNITENAIKACVGGGVVTLFCEGNTVTVTDNGKGMTAEQLSHITEPFYRTDKSRSRADGGVGLGLALCSQIVLHHGAEMKFESEVGRGTTVNIIFKT